MVEYDSLRNDFILKVQQDKKLAKESSFIINGINFGEEKHKFQKSKSDQGPYFRHCLRVAMKMIEEEDCDKDLIVGALLHDVVEDTQTSLNEVKENFGDKVTLFVKGLTKVSSKFKEEWGEERYYAEGFFGPLKEAGKIDKRIWKIKLADRYDNMLNYYQWAPFEKLTKYSWEAEQLILFAQKDKVKTTLLDILAKEIAKYKEITKSRKQIRL